MYSGMPDDFLTAQMMVMFEFRKFAQVMGKWWKNQAVCTMDNRIMSVLVKHNLNRGRNQFICIIRLP